MRILVLAAHPDDEVLGVGATIARHVRAGDDVTIVVAADCVSARGDVFDGALPVPLARAAVALGVEDVRFLGLRGMTLDGGPEIEVNRLVEAVVRDVRPDAVYTHHWADLNSDHRAVSRAAAVACRPHSGYTPARLLCFETPSSTEATPWTDFRPNAFSTLTEEDVERKMEAMCCYDREMRRAPHPRSVEALRVRAAFWGQAAGCSLAEAFVVAREVF